MDKDNVGATVGRHKNVDGFGDPPRQKVEKSVQDTVGATIGRHENADDFGDPPRQKVEKSVQDIVGATIGRHENADGFGDPPRQEDEQTVQDTVGATIGRPHDACEIGKPPRRKKNRLENHDYSSCGGYFVTICTAKRRNYFWQNVSGAYFANQGMFECPQDVELNEYGKIVEQAILNISAVYPAVTVDEYVVMPDHVHILLVIRADELGRPLVAPTLARMVQQFKGHVTKQIGQSIWQKLYYDHVIRNRHDYEEHLKYIYENPMRWIYDK